MPEIKLQKRNLNTGEAHLVVATFEPKEWSALQSFAAAAEDLSATEFGRAGMPHQYGISWETGKEPANTHPSAPREHVAEFLHQLRPLILSSEPFSFQRVTGILKRRLQDPQLRNLLKRQQEQYSGDDSLKVFAISIQGHPVNSEAALQQWLNGWEYHRDHEKREAVGKYYQALGEDVTNAVFLSALVGKAWSCTNVAKVIRWLSGDGERQLRIEREDAAFESILPAS